jgi:hypothetical protein
LGALWKQSVLKSSKNSLKRKDNENCWGTIVVGFRRNSR